MSVWILLVFISGSTERQPLLRAWPQTFASQEQCTAKGEEGIEQKAIVAFHCAPITPGRV